jgi:hypothetical protein
MRPRTRYPLILASALLAALAILVAPGSASAQAGSGAACPSTFDVLHDDHVGALALAAGPYRITTTGGLACADASDLFRQFLEDFDGKLPRGWHVDAATRTFSRGGVSFTVTRASSPSGGGGGGHYPNGSLCPGTFKVLQKDHIGTFTIPKGVYDITLLSVGRLTCGQASSYMSSFVFDYDGILPSPWFIDPETGSFMRGSRNVGFRLKLASRPPTPSGGSTKKRCPGTFRVLHNDHIGRLSLRKGPYWVTRLGGLPCKRASSLLASFLDDPNGVLARPWVVNVKTGTFLQGRGSKRGFRIKPAR